MSINRWINTENTMQGEKSQVCTIPPVWGSRLGSLTKAERWVPGAGAGKREEGGVAP